MLFPPNINPLARFNFNFHILHVTEVYWKHFLPLLLKIKATFYRVYDQLF